MRDSQGREVRYQSNGPLPSRAVPPRIADANPMPAIAVIPNPEHLALIGLVCFACGWALAAAIVHHLTR